MTAMDRLIGGISMLLGAVLFSTKAVMVKLVLPYGIDAISLLLLRMLFALPIYVAIAIYLRYRSTNSVNRAPITPHLPQLIALGVVGYYLASYFDFTGLEFIPASLELSLIHI